MPTQHVLIVSKSSIGCDLVAKWSRLLGLPCPEIKGLTPVIQGVNSSHLPQHRFHVTYSYTIDRAKVAR